MNPRVVRIYVQVRVQRRDPPTDEERVADVLFEAAVQQFCASLAEAAEVALADPVATH
jgi:hypothetical protein